MDSSTIAFRHALPLVLLPAAPPLAALHATRARILHPDPSLPARDPSCERCGSFLVHHSRTFARKSSAARIHRRSCRICGTAVDTPLPRPIHSPHAAATDTASTPSPQPPVPTPAPSRRPKHKSGLQQLLARTREKEKERQKQKQDSTQLGGLAAFLSDLS